MPLIFTWTVLLAGDSAIGVAFLSVDGLGDDVSDLRYDADDNRSVGDAFCTAAGTVSPISSRTIDLWSFQSDISRASTISHTWQLFRQGSVSVCDP